MAWRCCACQHQHQPKPPPAFQKCRIWRLIILYRMSVTRTKGSGHRSANKTSTKQAPSTTDTLVRSPISSPSSSLAHMARRARQCLYLRARSVEIAPRGFVARLAHAPTPTSSFNLSDRSCLIRQNLFACHSSCTFAKRVDSAYNDGTE